MAPSQNDFLKFKRAAFYGAAKPRSKAGPSFAKAAAMRVIMRIAH